MVRRLFALFATLGMVAVSAVTAAPASSQSGDPTDPKAAVTRADIEASDAVLPMIFVHGFMGSGQQFEAQALRFTSNGYPTDHIDVFEHDSLSWPGSQDAVWARMDQQIDALRTSTGKAQVYLLGHSQGTGVVQGYLNSDPARAARVAAYVNLDGGPGGTVPASVRTLAIWGEGDASRQIPDATNIQFANQSHTEVVNSSETFAAIYEFLLGTRPRFVEVVREPADEISVSGRVLLFPENAGASGTELQINEVDGTTGLPLDDQPEATYHLTGDGSWGPFAADGDAFYEFTIVRPGAAVHHVYLQRFVRSSQWVRILTSEPDGLANSFWEPSATSQNLAILRNSEWWGDQGAQSDQLRINGHEILNATTSPRSNRTIGIFVHDADSDGRTDLQAKVAPTGLPFLTGIDLVLPAGNPPPGTTSVVAVPRKGEGAESVCIPAYESVNNRSSIQFNSFHQLMEPDGSISREPVANPTCAPAPPETETPTTTPGVPGCCGEIFPARPSPATPIRGRSSYTG